MGRKEESNQRLTTKPQKFFQNQLIGEESPSFVTMQTLYDSATDLLARQPWNLLAEDKLVLIEAAGSGELCFCSVMGALGQVRALHVYLGSEGYQLFKKLQSGETMTVGEFYAAQRSVYVEFVRLGELTSPDRNLLKAMGHPLKRGTLAPMFRSVRAGYYPWYVTEGEARILAKCQRAVVTMCELIRANPPLDYWDKENAYPLLSRKSENGTEEEYCIRMVEAPSFPLPMAKLPNVDEARLRRIREGRYPSQGVLEVDHFYGAGMIGKKNERKACFRMGLAIDAESGLAYPPEVSLPATSTGDVLARVVLQAIESACALPYDVRVRDGEFKVLLDPLALALGFCVRVTKSLPALDLAKKQLLEMMGDRGPLS
jgi:hypothetical protein